MKLTRSMIDLVCDLEYLVGDECYNPNSYDGWTGDEGCSFRYPVYFRADKDSDELTKTRMNIREKCPTIPKESIGTVKYKFGSNHLFIGNGIVNILNELEKRYNLNFNELEKNRHKK